MVENHASDCVMALSAEFGSSSDSFPLGRARIVAKRSIGSAALLDGLTCEVVGAHPIAPGWVKIALVADAGELERRRVKYRDWSISKDRLVPMVQKGAASDLDRSREPYF